MQFSDQTIGIIIGSGIALFSSFLVTVLTLFFNERKEKNKQKFELEKLNEFENIKKRKKDDKEKDKNIRLVRDFENLSPSPVLNNLNLSGVLLTGINLRKATMRGAIFSGANLRAVCMVNADLTGSEFANSNLEGADFTGANLTFANFTGANLSQANLSQANLTRTNFSNADLNDCDVEENNLKVAILNHTRLPDGHFSK